MTTTSLNTLRVGNSEGRCTIKQIKLFIKFLIYYFAACIHCVINFPRYGVFGRIRRKFAKNSIRIHSLMLLWIFQPESFFRVINFSVKNTEINSWPVFIVKQTEVSISQWIWVNKLLPSKVFNLQPSGSFPGNPRLKVEVLTTNKGQVDNWQIKNSA